VAGVTDAPSKPTRRWVATKPFSTAGIQAVKSNRLGCGTAGVKVSWPGRSGKSSVAAANHFHMWIRGPGRFRRDHHRVAEGVCLARSCLATGGGRDAAADRARPPQQLASLCCSGGIRAPAHRRPARRQVARSRFAPGRSPVAWTAIDEAGSSSLSDVPEQQHNRKRARAARGWRSAPARPRNTERSRQPRSAASKAGCADARENRSSTGGISSQLNDKPETDRQCGEAGIATGREQTPHGRDHPAGQGCQTTW